MGITTPEWSGLQTLVVVCGQSVYKSNDFSTWEICSNWIPGRDDPKKYVKHIECGIKRAGSDKKALLVFSGGQTRNKAGPISEALSYWKVAEHNNWWVAEDKTIADIKERVALEEFARDSFENLLFSICRFFECVHSYPQHVTVIGFGGKKTRFDEHFKAIGWPTSAYSFIGVDESDVDRKDAEKLQVEDSKLDPLEFKNPSTEKRNSRNPFVRRPPYLLTCPYPFEGFPSPHLWSAVLNR